MEKVKEIFDTFGRLSPSEKSSVGIGAAAALMISTLLVIAWTGIAPSLFISARADQLPPAAFTYTWGALSGISLAILSMAAGIWVYNGLFHRPVITLEDLTKYNYYKVLDTFWKGERRFAVVIDNGFTRSALVPKEENKAAGRNWDPIQQWLRGMRPDYGEEIKIYVLSSTDVPEPGTIFQTKRVFETVNIGGELRTHEVKGKTRIEIISPTS